MEIEKLATSAIDDIIFKTDYIIPYVNSGDKEPSWDGYLDVYSDPSKKKEFFCGKALIQIKGRVCKKFSAHEITFSVSVTDLKNYRIEGGTIFFVVQISKTGEKRIFYNALLPFEINKLLDNVGKKKSLSVKMYAFPTDKNEVANIIFNFIRDKESQSLIKDGKSIGIDDLIKQFGKDKLKYSFTYTGLGYDRNKPYEYLFNHDVYLYAQHTEMNIKVPINHMWRAEIFQSSLTGEVKVGNHTYYDNFNIVHKRDSEEVHIGKSIVFTINNNSTQKLKYNLKGNLDERIVAEGMMLHLLKTKKFFINDICFEINPSYDEIKMFDEKNMSLHIKYLTELKEVLDYLEVKDPLDCSNLSETDEEYIRMLIMAFKYKRQISFNEYVPPVATVPIGNLTIMLCFKLQNDGKYLLDNYLKCDMDVSGELRDGTRFLTSKYTILTADDFVKVSNINEECIVNELISIDNSSHIARTTLTLLEMIKAYDANKDLRLLKAAIRLSEWLNKKQSIDISLINQYQCYYRCRELTTDENATLEKIVKQNDDNLQIKIAANILLKKAERANKLLKNLSREERGVFKEYPIYSLLLKQNKVDMNKIPEGTD